MDEFEQQLRARLDQSRASYEEAPDPFAPINQRAGRRQRRRRAFAALAAGCVVGLVGVPIAIASIDDSSQQSSGAAPTWSARIHEETGASHVEAGAPPATALANGVVVPSQPKGGSGGVGGRVVAPGAAPGNPGSSPVTSAPSNDVTPNAVTPGGTKDGGTKDGGTTADGTKGGGTAADGTKGGAMPDAPVADGLAPSIDSGQTSANLAARATPSCGGPSVLTVGEEGVFTAPDRSADPFSWAPSEPGAFDVVLDGPSGVVCQSAVSVGDVAPSASDPVTSP